VRTYLRTIQTWNKCNACWYTTIPTGLAVHEPTRS